MVDANSEQIVGPDILHDPRLNKGTAPAEQKGDVLKLHGLLPPRVFTQVERSP